MPDQETRNFLRKRFAKGSRIFVEGDTGDMAYVIQKGRVEVVKGLTEQSTIAVRSVGDVIGEMALFDDSARIATIIALEDTDVIGISRQAFRTRLDAMEPAMRAIMESLVNRLTESSTKLVVSKGQDVWRKRL